MSSISDTLFMIKYDFFKKEDIPQYAIVKIITIINMACLIEDIKTLKRTWVMKYDIYPLNNNLGGYWEYSKIHDKIAIEQGLK
jgi:hypothetical protein